MWLLGRISCVKTLNNPLIVAFNELMRIKLKKNILLQSPRTKMDRIPKTVEVGPLE